MTRAGLARCPGVTSVAVRQSPGREALSLAARRTGLASLALVVFLAVFAALHALGLGRSSLGPSDQLSGTAADSSAQLQLDRAMRAHGCTTDSLPAGSYPAHALVRDRGRTSVRLTSFAEGWAMYRGTVPGTLVAVCSR